MPAAAVLGLVMDRNGNCQCGQPGLALLPSPTQAWPIQLPLHMATTDSIKIAVRVRPFKNRENERKSKCVIEMENWVTTIM
ncbi:hypothetical protein SeLEV6574_g05304 [Synchytrium endobioticum]|uniref:Kinesin motor domain-containing protein n=1 Tax=Synchytrium endobioticum TaxID=286115 RepID=A0A507CVC4_9FUNG|nr:hypothetical protein SeLEV6574_g05304 [Synchytrium endobioticum]